MLVIINYRIGNTVTKFWINISVKWSHCCSPVGILEIITRSVDCPVFCVNVAFHWRSTFIKIIVVDCRYTF